MASPPRRYPDARLDALLVVVLIVLFGVVIVLVDGPSRPRCTDAELEAVSACVGDRTSRSDMGERQAFEHVVDDCVSDCCKGAP